MARTQTCQPPSYGGNLRSKSRSSGGCRFSANTARRLVDRNKEAILVQRIILHAGTPKTGTTSLQIALERHRAQIACHGLLYPTTMATAYSTSDGRGGVKPKHQWLVSDLVAHSGGGLRDHMAAALAEASPSTHTVVLSTEGLFNHWWDFSKEGRRELSALSRTYKVELWVWFREPIRFFISNYVQMLKNPPTEVACYGRDWSPDEMLDDPWFVRHLDYKGFIEEVTQTLGEGSVRPYAYRGATVADFFAAAGLPALNTSELREHVTLGGFGVQVLRHLNKLSLDFDAKIAAVNIVNRLDAELGMASQPLQIDPSTRARVLAFCGPSVEWLRREYGLELSEDSP